MKQYHNTVIINRAVPGSGKTTISGNIKAEALRNGLSYSCRSTDDYFMTGDGRYVFNIQRLQEYHRLNLAGFIEDLKNNIHLVVCDNTNLSPDQTEPYTRAARRYNYKIILINFLPRDLAAHLEAQKVTPQKPDAHNVPEEKLIEMIENFNRYSSLLNRNYIINPLEDKIRIWDEETFKMLPTEFALLHYDYDELITIRPEDYKTAKEEIGGQILTIMKC